jgi:hypothetical protein
MTSNELGRRLEEAARVRAVLRRATIDLQEFGRLMLEEIARRRAAGSAVTRGAAGATGASGDRPPRTQ